MECRKSVTMEAASKYKIMNVHLNPLHIFRSTKSPFISKI